MCAFLFLFKKTLKQTAKKRSLYNKNDDAERVAWKTEIYFDLSDLKLENKV
jgi:hypothetical protein